MSTDLQRAAAILREYAASLKDSMTIALSDPPDWAGEVEAKADHDEYLALAERLDALSSVDGDAVGEVVIEAMGIGDAQMVRFHMYKEIPPVGTKLYTTPPSVQKQQEEVRELRESLDGHVALKLEQAAEVERLKPWRKH